MPVSLKFTAILLASTASIALATATYSVSAHAENVKIIRGASTNSSDPFEIRGEEIYGENATPDNNPTANTNSTTSSPENSDRSASHDFVNKSATNPNQTRDAFDDKTTLGGAGDGMTSTTDNFTGKAKPTLPSKNNGKAGGKAGEALGRSSGSNSGALGSGGGGLGSSGGGL